MDGPLTIYRAKINAKRNSGILAYRESLGNAGIPGHACIFRNYKYLIFLPSPTHSHHALTNTLTLTQILRQELQELPEFLVIPYKCNS
jgi:hypothetical protein